MKFDKQTVVLMTICVVFLLLWQPFCEWMGWVPSPAEKAKTQAEAQAQTGDKPSETPKPSPETPKAEPEKKEVKAAAPAASAPTLPDEKLSNNLVEVAINPVDASVSSIVLKACHKTNSKENVVIDGAGISPRALTVSEDMEWTVVGAKVVEKTKDTLVAAHTVRRGEDTFEIVRKWRLLDDFSIDFDLQIKNTDAKSLRFGQLEVSAGGIQSLKAMSGDLSTTGAHNVEVCMEDGNTVEYFAADAKDKNFVKSAFATPVSWLGVCNKYFACLLSAEKGFSAGNTSKRELRTVTGPGGAKEEYHILHAGGKFKEFKLDPGNTASFKMKYFAGPKEMRFLDEFAPAAKKVMHLSFWSPFEWLAQLLLVALNHLKDLCGSYGWAIILLTVIVRAVFWPITQRANASMKKMQKLQPLVTEIREKFKDKPQEMNVKIMGLYKEHKVNPLGGCLPILLQLPVFFALYASLDGAVELRQIPFAWCSDLSQPDTVAVIMGLPLNPLILVMTLLMFVQQKMTPAMGDPMQQKMLLMMPFVMLIFMYSLPSGLTLYWTVSQIISIIQLLINKRINDKEENKTGAAKTT